MKNQLFLLLFLLGFAPLGAQKLDLTQLEGLKIRSIGPAGMSGRVTAIDVWLGDPEMIYVGTASGGVWRSRSGGVTWEPIFDEAPVASIGAIAVNQKNPDEIWVGTGEGNPRNTQNSGQGLFKTIDGGKTWTCVGLEDTRVIHRIILHRDDPNTVFVAALGSAWGPNPERGVFKSTDGGKSWRKVLFVNDSTGCADLVIDPRNPNKFLAAMWEYGRKPWTFHSGGPGSGIFVSFDGGESWKKRSSEDGLPKGDLGRIGLAIAPSKPDIVYALVEAKENALYKSTDGGFKWRKVSTDDNIGNRPFYYSDIFVDPHNENRVFSLWSILSKSEDGGKSWSPWVGWKVHPDHHAFWVHPQNPDFMIEGNDGGLNISYDGGRTWRFVENLPLAQFYHINYDLSIPYRIGGGMQDNGSWIGPSSIWKSGGITNEDWQEVYFGDGFDVMFRPDNPRFVYAMSQGGNLGYVDTETGQTKFIRPVHPEGVRLRFNWNAALAQDPFNPCGIYYGSQFLHRSRDCGQSWEIISPDLTTNDSTKQQQEKSGGLTIDNTTAENFTTIIAIAPSPLDSQLIWVGTDDGNLQLTRDGGITWTNLADRLPDARPGSWIPYIEAGTHNPGEAFIVVNDYRRNDWRPMVFHTTDFGATFRRIVDESQVSGHALSIVQDLEEPRLLFLGTDHGLWVSIDAGANWSKWTNGFPSAPTADLKIHPREHDLIVATFGRAAWILDDIRPLREIARSSGQVLEQPFKVFPAPDAYLAEFRSYQGIRFAADARFQGQNRFPDAMITVWVQPPAEKPGEDKEALPEEAKEGEEAPAEEAARPTPRKKPKVKVRVLNAGGDTIRTFSSEVDTGMTRIHWNLRTDGVEFPSRRKRRPDADPPAGYEVLPGTYKLLLSYGKHTDSTFVTVHLDPRLRLSLEDLQAKQAAYESFYDMVRTAKEGFDRLQEAGKTLKRVNEALALAPDSLKKDLGQLTKDLKKKIAELEKLYMMPPDTKGIQRSPDLLNTALFRASSYLNSSDGAPNPTARLVLEQARQKTREVLEAVNAFFEKDFQAFRERVESQEIRLFKDFEPLRLKE